MKRWSTQLQPVRGVTASELFAEAARHATGWDYLRWIGGLRGRALLIVTADDQNRTDMDALATALRKIGSAALQYAAVAAEGLPVVATSRSRRSRVVRASRPEAR